MSDPVLPDDSSFFTMSLPLPEDHWLYGPRGSSDIGVTLHRGAVRDAVRLALKRVTQDGKDMDFDPDALVLEVQLLLCGPLEAKCKSL
jgi:hypothetical protein